jgi:hypothetical protein
MLLLPYDFSSLPYAETQVIGPEEKSVIKSWNWNLAADIPASQLTRT